MNQAQEYLEMIKDTTDLVAQEKATQLGNAAAAYQSSGQLANNVEFWRWMGANYPRDLSSSQLIQQAANTKSRWLGTQLQGKGYEWDFMTLQRSDPTKILSIFDAGNCPTQPGIDITEKDVLTGSVKATYQNKAYLSNNNPNLHNTPKDAVVVANREKVGYAQKQGYQTKAYMGADEIQEVREKRFQQAAEGNAQITYTLQNVAEASAKAGAVAAVIGMTTETVCSYKMWKSGQITKEQYLKEILKAGGDAGVTGATTAAAMVPVQAAITAAGTSTLIGIPVAIAFSAAINSVVAPCFGRGKYRQILNEARYYQSIEDVYDDFIIVIERSANQYANYINQMQAQVHRYEQMRRISENMEESLRNLYDSI